ncbi:hypothetical protein [Streptomyces sp. CRN 30]|uniref:hypothetical protein n=1 Tax=Streptomyces sp. CRN 30 TaxID=3075613 RepID=UPI002A81CF66|nr:hypothetical protein [Streptomyces sp. CRN 30]
MRRTATVLLSIVALGLAFPAQAAFADDGPWALEDPAINGDYRDLQVGEGGGALGESGVSASGEIYNGILTGFNHPA